MDKSPMDEARPRYRYLGGADMAAILGESPWKSPFEVWQYKTGRVGPQPQSERMSWGLALERIILEEYSKRTGYRVAVAGFRMLPGCDYIGGHADALAWPTEVDGEDIPAATANAPGMRLLEIKTASAASRRVWDRGIPFDYQCQAQLYLLLHGLQLCTFVVLFGGQEMQTYDLEADPILQHRIVTEAHDFWTRYVLLDVPPPPADAPELRDLPGNAREADDECRHDLAKLVRLRQQIDALEQQEAAVVDRLKEYTDGSISVQGRIVAGWQTKTRKTQVVEGKTWQQFSIRPSTTVADALQKNEEKNDEGVDSDMA